MKTLQALLCGKLNPLEKVPQTEEYHEVVHRLSRASHELEIALTPEQAALLQEYKSESSQEACMVQEYLLLYGVRLGMELQKELQDTTCLPDI